MALVLSHVVTLGLIRRIGRWVGGARGRNGGIYRNAGVRLQVGGGGGGAVDKVEIGLGVMAIGLSMITGAQGAGCQRRTCCLSHTCRTAWLGVRRVVVLRTSEIIGISRRTRSSSGRWLVQTVV